jgi:hypothetical protein
MRRCGAIILAMLATGCGGSSETAKFEIKSIGEEVYAMVGQPSQPPSTWTAAAKEQCEGKQICTVMGWTDAANAATGMPMLDREAKAMVFHYALNRNASFEQSTFDCRTFKGIPQPQCMATE